MLAHPDSLSRLSLGLSLRQAPPASITVEV